MAQRVLMMLIGGDVLFRTGDRSPSSADNQQQLLLVVARQDIDGHTVGGRLKIKHNYGYRTDEYTHDDAVQRRWCEDVRAMSCEVIGTISVGN